jgi:predicted dehydrogenase
MADELSYGLIGCGEIAVQNCKGVLEAEKSRLAATFDVKSELAEDLASKQDGARAYATQEELLAADDVDAVIISVPHFLHEPVAVAAFGAGKHVLCEKPIALNVAQGQRMVDAATEAGRKLGVCFMQRWRGMCRVSRDVVQRGLIGNLMGWVMAELGFKRESYWSGGYSQRAKTDWRLRWGTAGGGYLVMNLIHNIDYFRYICDQEVVGAKAVGGNYNSPPGVEVEDLIAATISLSGGGVGIIAGSSSTPGGGLGENRIIGTKGQIKLGGYGSKSIDVYLAEGGEVEGQAVPAGEWTAIELADNDAGAARTAMIGAFSRWVLDGEPFLSPGAGALKSFAVCESIYRDAGLGKY